MSFEFEKVTFTEPNFTVHVKKNFGSDFAFYILSGNKRIAAKSCNKKTYSELEVNGISRGFGNKYLFTF